MRVLFISAAESSMIAESSANSKGCLYTRVSTDEQHPENQLVPLRKLAEALSIEIVSEYVDVISGGVANRPEFRNMLRAADRHDFSIILTWSLDRFSREGILETLAYIKRLRRANVGLKSLQEPWMDTRDEGMGELLIAIMSWFAKKERERISERTKEGLKGKENVGKRGKDKKPRKRSGYCKRWERKRQ